MGRLTLNVLLSFAQFEREVTSERIRDKIAASKRKGLLGSEAIWPPRVLSMKDGKIAIVEEEAELGQINLPAIPGNLAASTKLFTGPQRTQTSGPNPDCSSTGATRGGIPFRPWAAAVLPVEPTTSMSERVKYKNEILQGEQPPDSRSQACLPQSGKSSLAQWYPTVLSRATNPITC